MKNKLILVAGCSGSGKTTIAQRILENFKKNTAQIICLDQFYKKDKKFFPKIANSGHVNYDHPDAFDWKQLKKCLLDLLNNKQTILPIYNYLTQSRNVKGQKITPTNIIILEGTLPMYNKTILSLASLKIFVQTPLDECFIRRLTRDINIRGRTIASVIKQWKEAVRPMYHLYVAPTKQEADLILPWDKINVNGLSFLTKTIKEIFKDKNNDRKEK